MINCPKCGADNQIGAIFCRGCGEKLELDEIQPEHVQEAARAHEGKPKSNWFGIIKNVVMLIILTITVLILISLFMPPPGGLPAVAAAEDQKVYAAAKDEVNRSKRKNTTTLSNDELNYVARELLGVSPDAKKDSISKELVDQENGLMLLDVFVDIKDPATGTVRIIIHEGHPRYGWLRFYRTMEAKVTADDTGLKLDLPTAKYYMGKFPMNFSDFTRNNVLGHFSRAWEGKTEAQQLAKAFKRFKIEESRVKFYRSAKSSDK